MDMAPSVGKEIDLDHDATAYDNMLAEMEYLIPDAIRRSDFRPLVDENGANRESIQH